MTAPVRVAEAGGKLIPWPLGDGTPIIGISPAIQRAIALARRFAPTGTPILLVGPTGCGKELFARQIHLWSGRPGAFIDVNAAALPREMIESLLFGHRRGAFTGATEAADGLMAAAGGGTLFLDELASLPPEGQAKLLRAVENGEVRRLGDVTNRAVECRFLGAVQDDLEERITRGSFRADLFHRLAGAVIRLPALAERREDIGLLARHFAAGCGAVLPAASEGELLQHDWPGNVRELRSAVIRARHLEDQEVISPQAIRDALALTSTLGGRLGLGAAAIADPLIELCRRHAWDIGRAAADAGVSRATLYRRLRAQGIKPSTLKDRQVGGLRVAP